jgi:hypothetical protein
MSLFHLQMKELWFLNTILSFVVIVNFVFWQHARSVYLEKFYVIFPLNMT